jgi:spore coat polysaccharide biosynthesis protein SpsF (cytidylyltransferase family)
MKMLKKSILGVVLLALVAMPAYAGHMKRTDWPCEFKFVDLCDIPVYMNVGLYVEILDQHLLKIILEQEDIDTYSGCVTIYIKSNFDLILGCYTELKDAGQQMGGKMTCEINPDTFVPKTLCEGVAEREVCVNYDKVGITHHDYGKDILVGDVIIQVKPGFECLWEDP